ncbi:hypothetical protein [Mycobacteroides franklinii]|uniref:hypothetical protein n=1 Tax=Mycobacteroides franklinii TaxID=948102 RepID=UPI000992F0F3|nr:hypothetical protein [Mycobacteroides franklinii]
MDAEYAPLTNDELLHALRAALLGEVQTVLFHPDFPEVEKRGSRDTVLYSAANTFRVQLTAPVEKKRLKLNKSGDQRLRRDVEKALTWLSDPGPRHPPLRTERYGAFDKHFGEQIFQSNVQTKTPAAWRMWWFYDQSEDRTITVAAMGHHPDSSTAPPR